MTVTSDASGVGRHLHQDQRNSAGPRRMNRARAPKRNGRQNIYAALDLGTNNCRLLIARPTHGGFQIIDAFSRIVRLGEGLSTSGNLSDAGMDRVLDALKICMEKIERRGATHIRSVATEACRAAGNSNAFVKRVFDETGLAFDVISPEEEARLAALGCTALFDDRYDHALVFDIGGGSTEIICARLKDGMLGEIVSWISLPVGVVTLAETMKSDPEHGDYVNLVSRVENELQSFAEDLDFGQAITDNRVQVIGTSGTVTTLMSVLLELETYDRSKIDGQWVGAPEIIGVARRIARMELDERHAHPCIGPERAELVVPGCAIFEAILESWPVPRICIADRGIREGILRSLMRCDPLVSATSRESGDIAL